MVPETPFIDALRMDSAIVVCRSQMSTSKLFSVLLLVGTTAHALPVGDRRERALTSTPSPDGKPAPATTVIPDTAQDRAATPDTTTSSSSTTTSSSTTSSTTSTTTTYEPRTAPAADTKPPPTTTTGEPPIFRQNTAADGDLEFEVDAGAGKAKRHKKAKKSKNGKKKGKAADSGLLIVPQLR